ncbi:fluoride efflux transporter FluC [uncultured Ilumatobacter sp.]|uniref:fluoride efflux transporter FluC n=1 Tax=Ilumatobacter sp. TaxID=1967498 RepID=UPI0030A49829
MTPVAFILAAAIGAVLRLLIGLTVCSWQALLVANTAGAAVLGYVSTADLSASTITVIGVGFCGALTTYSSFALEARSLGWRWGAFYAALTIGCVCAAASIGSTLA